MDQLTVDIITAESSLLVGAKVSSVIAPGIQGTFQVLPGHTTFLTELDTGPVMIEGTGGAKQFVVSGGFAEVMQGHVRILADQAQTVEGLDRATIEANLKELEPKLSEADPYSEEAEKLRNQLKFLEIQRDSLS